MLFNWEDKKFHNLPNGISPKVNATVRLVSELIHFDTVVQYINQDPTGIHLINSKGFW